MVTITLPPELEQVVREQAQQQGTTPELLTLEKLRSLLLPPIPANETVSMADFFAGYIGGLHSSEFVSGGANLSVETSHKFEERLLQKYREEQEGC